ncbi:MAG: class I SAM-dependent methyltransferase family protein [Candidatus Paceibacteria bacterium]
MEQKLFYMNQSQLEEKVRDIFEQEGFELEKSGDVYIAENEENRLEIQVFSSESFSAEEVEKKSEAGRKIFVDGKFSDLKNRIEGEVSVLEEEEERDVAAPSYEVIGNIAMINQLPDDMSEEEAVEGILEHQNIETVLLKKEPLEGEFRVGSYRALYGEETETTHREFDCRFRVDPTEVYFSERFGTERKRVADQVEKGEKVLVIGAGVGPFPVLIAKHSSAGKVIAVEKNPVAVEYLRENIQMNSEEEVEAVEADGKEFLESSGEKFDRIIIPIPEFAEEFLEVAMENLADNGVIHYYRFMENGNWEAIESEIEDAASDAGREFEIRDRVNCGDRGPGVERVCLDIKLV